jgi:8-oxo-dGTP diphosphatase
MDAPRVVGVTESASESEPDGDFRAAHLRHLDFVGAFGVIRRGDDILMVENLRRIGGRQVATWDLPGGQVEPGELLAEALVRELAEETGLELVGAPWFLFFQEGERCHEGERTHAWRSFFFGAEWQGDPVAGGEVQAVRWFSPGELAEVLTAPYHDSFIQWLQQGGLWFRSAWRD